MFPSDLSLVFPGRLALSNTDMELEWLYSSHSVFPCTLPTPGIQKTTPIPYPSFIQFQFSIQRPRLVPGGRVSTLFSTVISNLSSCSPTSNPAVPTTYPINQESPISLFSSYVSFVLLITHYLIIYANAQPRSLKVFLIL